MAHEHIVYMMLVESAATARDRATILEYAPVLEELARRDDHQPYLAISYRGYGIAHRLAGEYEQAEASLQQALKIFEELETPWQRGRTLYELGELAMFQGAGDLSREMYTQALEEFERIQAKPDMARTKAALGA
jgi:tetratricopeptide (TPR) repeat protein